MFIRPSFTLLAAVAAWSEVTRAAPGAPAAQKSESLSKRRFGRPLAGSVPYGAEVVSCNVPGVIALTFDDGPSPLTSGIVDSLDENGVPGTFFVVGKNGQDGLTTGSYDSLIKHMHNGGHQIASHSFTHPDFSEISYDEILDEMEQNENAIVDILGFAPTYFRPPYTSCNAQCYTALGDMGYHVTDYDLDTKDWESGGSESKARYSSAIQSANANSDSFIVLAHDVQDFTANGFVDFMIEVGKEKGFKFVTLGECLGDSRSNWYRNPETGEAVDAGEVENEPSTTAPTTTSTRSGPKPDETGRGQLSNGNTSPTATPSASASASASSEAQSSSEEPSSSSEVLVGSSTTVGTTTFTTASSTVTRPIVVPTSVVSSASAADADSSSSTSSASGSATPSTVDDSAASVPLPAFGSSLLGSLLCVAAWIML